MTGYEARTLAEAISAEVIKRTTDCNDNGRLDFCDIAWGVSGDCNADDIPDDCQLVANDCNANHVPDECDIANGPSPNCDGDATPDECQPFGRIYVDASATGANDGSSWVDAYTELRVGLANAHACRNAEVWVADGVYTPGPTVYDTFPLVADVAIYGGFAGGETLLEERDVENNVTTLSGAITGGPTGVHAAHVVTAEAGVGASAVLDGFTIRDGRATWDTATGFSGGGLWVKPDAAPTIRNCTFHDNDAAEAGGAAYLAGDAAVENCAFTGNGHASVSGFNGGAIAVVGASPALTACTFANNRAFSGAAVYVSDGSPQVDWCRFHANTANASGGAILLSGSGASVGDSYFGSNGAAGVGEGGGGIAVYSGSDPILFNNILSGNYADYGGAIDVYLASATIVNCSFYGNRAAISGGGLDNSSSLATQVINSIFRENLGAEARHEQISQALGDATLRIAHSNVQGGAAGVVHCGPSCTVDYHSSNIDTNALFLDPDGPDQLVGTPDDNLRLSSTSPCVDAGSNGAISGIGSDADGYDRIAFGAVDMGAYEVFVDCNSNSVPDYLDLMDQDGNGLIDMVDFQHMQICFGSTGAACMAVFDRALACGTLDLNDFVTFERQLS